MRTETDTNTGRRWANTWTQRATRAACADDTDRNAAAHRWARDRADRDDARSETCAAWWWNYWATRRGCA